MVYEVFVTIDAEQDLDSFPWYLLSEKKSEQAAKNLLDDYQNTLDRLTLVAGNLPPCRNEKLAALGYIAVSIFCIIIISSYIV